MDIQQLAVVLTEQDLTQLARKHLPDAFPVENLQFEISPEGLQVTGEYSLFVPVNFTTAWQLAVQEGKVAARLVRVHAFGLPVTVFRSMIVKMIADMAQKIDGLTCGEDLILADVDRLAAGEGVLLRSNLHSIQCETGSMLVTAGVRK